MEMVSNALLVLLSNMPPKAIQLVTVRPVYVKLGLMEIPHPINVLIAEQINGL